MAGKPKPVPRLGIHIRTAAGLLTGARHALEIGSQTFQIMSGNPSAWNPGQLDQDEAARFRNFCEENRLGPIFLHAGYLINLSCRTGRNAPIYAKSVRLLQQTMERSAALGCQYVVVHLGSRRGQSEAEALEALIEGICRLDPEGCPEKVQHRSRGKAATAAVAGRPVLLLENSAGSGDAVGSSFEELALVLREAKARGASQPLGICLDTAHMWGAGYDLSSRAAARRLVDEFDAAVGVDRLHLIHLNDSPVERGSLRDRHEHIGCGLISVMALEAIVRHPKLRHVAMIMETPGSTDPSDAGRMEDLRRLAAVSR